MLASADISTWMTDAGGFDVLPGVVGADGLLVPYEDLAQRQTIIRGVGFTIRVAALEDIITAKERADRPKDHDACPNYAPYVTPVPPGRMPNTARRCRVRNVSH